MKPILCKLSPSIAQLPKKGSPSSKELLWCFCFLCILLWAAAVGGDSFLELFQGGKIRIHELVVLRSILDGVDFVDGRRHPAVKVSDQLSVGPVLVGRTNGTGKQEHILVAGAQAAHLRRHHLGETQRAVAHRRVCEGIPQEGHTNGALKCGVRFHIELAQVRAAVGRIGVDPRLGEHAQELLFAVRARLKEPPVLVAGGKQLDDGNGLGQSVKAHYRPGARRKRAAGNHVQGVAVRRGGKLGGRAVGRRLEVANAAQELRVRGGARPSVGAAQAVHEDGDGCGV